MPRFHAIVLAGGRASRLEGIDKLLVRVEGRTLLARAIDAVADAAAVAVVGPRRDISPGREVLWLREDPPFSGPAHAVAAGMAALLAGAGNRVAVDPSGRRQWAASVVVARDLAAAVASAPTQGASLRSLIGRLDPVDVPVGAEAGADVDTPDDLEEYADDDR